MNHCVTFPLTPKTGASDSQKHSSAILNLLLPGVPEKGGRGTLAPFVLVEGGRMPFPSNGFFIKAR